MSIIALSLPLFAALWITFLIVGQPTAEWSRPGVELEEKLEHRFIFAFSPLIGWVNAMEKGGPPEEAAWNAAAQGVFKQSPELIEMAWMILERGTARAFRKVARLGNGSPALEQMDPEIFNYVKKGQRPLGFAYQSKGESFFEFQIPLQSENLFFGILIARYSLPQLLSSLTPDLPPGVALTLWSGEESLAHQNSTVRGEESFWLPFDAWGKKLTIELRTQKPVTAPGLRHFLGIQWLGFLTLLATFCLCLAWRSPSSMKANIGMDGEPVPLEALSTSWFSPSPTPAGEDSERLPVWAIAQKELIKEKLEKK